MAINMHLMWYYSKRILLVFFLFLVALQLWFFIHLLVWKWVNPERSSFMTIRLDERRIQNPEAAIKQVWVDYAQISNHLKRAVVAAEDDSFVEHYGFDIKGIRYALAKNQRKGRSVAGGSSITQQLAKNLFLSPKRSWGRKVQEAIITLMIELLWDKRRILEVYLNVVEWGDGVFGAEAAARHYYLTSAARLGPAQAARLAVMLPNPRKYERQYPAWVAAHAKRVQARMRYSKIP